MKRSIYFLILTLCLCAFTVPSVQAQRYLPRMGGVTLVGGTNEKLGFYADLGYSIYTKRQHHWNFGANFFQTCDKYYGTKLPLSQITAEGGYYLRVARDPRRTFFLSFGLEGVLGYEWVNWGRYSLPDGGQILDKNRFVFGGALGMEMEYYINDRFVVLFRAREKALANSDVGIFHTEVGLGLKIIVH